MYPAGAGNGGGYAGGAGGSGGGGGDCPTGSSGTATGNPLRGAGSGGSGSSPGGATQPSDRTLNLMPPHESTGARSSAPAEDAGSGQPGEMLRPGEWRPTPPRPPKPLKDDKTDENDRRGKPHKKPKSLAATQGMDWALRNAAAGATPITRPIRVAVHTDRLVILPDRGNAPGKVISLDRHTEDAIRPFVSALQTHIESWGMAGNRMYWRPILQVQVAPGGEERFRDFRCCWRERVEVNEEWAVGRGQWAVGVEWAVVGGGAGRSEPVGVIRNYRDLIAWQKAMDYAVMVHKESACFPKDEVYGLRGQLRESSVSVPSNIAEGHGRRSTKEFRHFLSISYGSLCEAQTQTLLAERFGYWDNPTI